tara:strand:+ start:48 stop:1088 length:1041 start_codon:yes stop_codon:yes gene_type:complete
MINVKLLSLDEFKKEKNYYFSVKKFPNNIFNSDGYFSLYENATEKAYYFISENKNEVFIYPFLLCDIPGENTHKDIKSPYSFGGPTSNSSNKTFIKDSFKKLREILMELNVICEVIKFNPYIPYIKEILDNYDGKIIKERDLVLIDFDRIDTSNLLDVYRKECTKKIKRVSFENKDFKIDIGNKSRQVEEFRKIYEKNLEYNRASNHYYYNDDFYNSLMTNFSDNFLIFSIYINKELLTSQLLIHDTNNVYCHLYGAMEKSRKSNIIVYSYHALISWAVDNGFKKINLGGGRTSDPMDSLYTFKKNFSNYTIPFYVGEKIIKSEIYNEVCEKYAGNESNILQKYRA